MKSFRKLLKIRYLFFQGRLTAVLNEYCARYGVNPIHQYLILVNNLLQSAENDGMMDVKSIGENYWSLKKFKYVTSQLW